MVRIRRVFSIAGAAALSLALIGCENAEEAYARGYSDGYAVGYNTACEIRATLVEGDWSNENYSRGYATGQTDGIIVCNNFERNEATE